MTHSIEKTGKRGSSKARPSGFPGESWSILRRASRPTARLAVWRSIPPPSSNITERSAGGPVALIVAVQREPDRQLTPAQVGHAGIDEGVEKLEAKPGNPLRSLPPGGRIAPLAHGSSPSLSLATRL